MFKENWEKTSVKHQMPEGVIKKMVQVAYPNKILISHELIAGGCANLNFKILFQNENSPLILRIYLRDKDAAYREKKLGLLLKQSVPAPMTYYIGMLDNYRFAITEFMPGISLRSLLLNDAQPNLEVIMYEVGTVLSKIASHEFLLTGSFDQELNVISSQDSDECITFAKNCLKHKTVLSALTPEMLSKIDNIFIRYGHLFPSKSDKRLVHGDFDPANILVSKVDGNWKVSGVLDWEFSFSGSMLWDVANMLRYAHKMPAYFKDAFLRSLASRGLTLPTDWQARINLLNLLALLDCLQRSDPKKCPNQHADIFDLINYILTRFQL